MLDMIIEIGNPFQHKFSKQMKLQNKNGKQKHSMYKYKCKVKRGLLTLNAVSPI